MDNSDNTMTQTLTKYILNELEIILATFPEEQVNNLLAALLEIREKSGVIIGAGTGRTGFVVRGFIMRLNHLGINACFQHDTYVPPVSATTLVIACSSSGQTSGILNFLEKVNSAGGRIFAITGNSDSLMANMTDGRVVYAAPTSIQPMNTLNEQALFIFFDLVILKLMRRLNISEEFMNSRHFNAE